MAFWEKWTKHPRYSTQSVHPEHSWFSLGVCLLKPTNLWISRVSCIVLQPKFGFQPKFWKVSLLFL
jgi:hypothetical protein